MTCTCSPELMKWLDFSGVLAKLKDGAPDEIVREFEEIQNLQEIEEPAVEETI